MPYPREAHTAWILVDEQGEPLMRHEGMMLVIIDERVLSELSPGEHVIKIDYYRRSDPEDQAA